MNPRLFMPMLHFFLLLVLLPGCLLCPALAADSAHGTLSTSTPNASDKETELIRLLRLHEAAARRLLAVVFDDEAYPAPDSVRATGWTPGLDKQAGQDEVMRLWKEAEAAAVLADRSLLNDCLATDESVPPASFSEGEKKSVFNHAAWRSVFTSSRDKRMPEAALASFSACKILPILTEERFDKLGQHASRMSPEQSRIALALLERYLLTRQREAPDDFAEPDRAIVWRLNEWRLMADLPVFISDKRLHRACSEHARWMQHARTLSHRRSNPAMRSLIERSKAAGHPAPHGEVLAGLVGLNALHGWRSSASHLRILLASESCTLGISHAEPYTALLTGRASEDKELDPCRSSLRARRNNDELTDGTAPPTTLDVSHHP